MSCLTGTAQGVKSPPLLSREERLIADLRHQNALLAERNSDLLRRVAWYEARTGFKFSE